MKQILYILGSSNSILHNGYVKHLRENHKVINLSIGASPFYQYVFNICQIDKKQFEKEPGVIILENIVNDDNIGHGLDWQKSFADSAKKAILFAASRYPVIFVEILNKRHHEKPQKSFFSSLYRGICLDKKIPFFSFNDSMRREFPHISIDELYMDVSHIREAYAYRLSTHLVDFISRIDFFNKKQRDDLAVHKSNYSYIPIQGDNALTIGTSLRELRVRRMGCSTKIQLKGEYLLEAIVLDIGCTNCIMEFSTNKGAYYQGFRYKSNSKPEFKVVGISPRQCYDGLNITILSQKTMNSKCDGKKIGVYTSPHETYISSDFEEAQAAIVGFVVKNRVTSAIEEGGD